MASQDSKHPLIAIQIGEPPSAHGIKKRSRPAHGKRHRAHVLQEESSSESGSDDEHAVRHEVITTYGHSEDEQEKQGRRSKRSQQDEGGGESSSARNGSKGHKNGDREGATNTQADASPVKWGLNINLKGAPGNRKDDRRDTRPRIGRGESGRQDKKGETGHRKRERDLDEEALDALMGSEPPKKSRRDSGDLDREPRPEDYRAVPIDDFGATLLRSFGWDGQMKGKVKEVVKHANLTGLGAKDAKEVEDLGAWNQKTPKDSRPVRLEDYQREQNKRRERVADRQKDSYKREREREREREYRRDS